VESETGMPLTLREMNLRVFRGDPNPHVLFQPRFEPWYAYQQKFGTMPESYRRMGLLGVFDEVGCSMRYVHYDTGMPDPVHTTFDEHVVIHRKDGERERMHVIETPYGDLVQQDKLTQDDEWRQVTFPVKGPESLRALRWLCGHMTRTFSPDDFEQGSRFIGERGEPQFWLPKSPYQALAQSWMKLQDLIYALADCPEEVEATMQAIDATYDRLWDEVLAYGDHRASGVRIVNFGENIHDHLLSPRYFERYLIPWYEKRSGQLRRAGIFTHNHIDGYFHSLLKYLKYLPFDGIEALTPQPQGDVPLEVIKEHIGDKVLLDGIPAVLFMNTYSADDLMQMVEKIVALFSPRLVLGVSDEVPQGAEAVEAMRRLQMVSQWCREHRPNAITA
jgi:hypothetical protein